MEGENNDLKTEWTRDVVYALIDHWQNYEFLYNSKHKLYKNKHARSDALFKISEKLKPLLPNVTADAVATKIGNLRGQYTREKAKMKETMKSGAGTDEIKTPTAYWFNRMEFLNNFIKTRKGANNCTTIFLDDSNPCSIEVLDESLPPIKKKKENELFPIVDAQTHLEKASAAIESMAASCAVKVSRKDVESFGQHIKAEMDKITDEDLFDEMQLKIQNIIYEFKCRQREINKINY